jgi:hypothetical protein
VIAWTWRTTTPNITSQHTLRIGTETVPEMLVIFKQLTLLIVQEDFITFSQHESFRSERKKEMGQTG